MGALGDVASPCLFSQNDDSGSSVDTEAFLPWDIYDIESPPPQTNLHRRAVKLGFHTQSGDYIYTQRGELAREPHLCSGGRVQWWSSRCIWAEEKQNTDLTGGTK